MSGESIHSMEMLIEAESVLANRMVDLMGDSRRGPRDHSRLGTDSKRTQTVGNMIRLLSEHVPTVNPQSAAGPPRFAIGMTQPTTKENPHVSVDLQ